MTGYIDPEDDGLMVADQAELVNASFSRVFLRKGELVNRFYDHFFSEQPEVESLFQDDFGAQKEMFFAMLAMVVKRLAQQRDFETLVGKLHRDHASFDISEEQWQSAADSLVFALRDVLQGDLSPEEGAAWSAMTNKLILAIVALRDKKKVAHVVRRG